jgi:hypothetical protein
MIKIGIFTDFHCGHLLGLTPPESIQQDFELAELMQDFWTWFARSLTHDYDFAFFLGDLVEGEGKQETTFHLTTDVDRQIEISQKIIRYINAKQNIFVYGTPYHTGKIMDYENQIAREFGGDISTYKKVNIGGVKFDLAHDIGKSGTPTGGDIMLKKEMLWTALYDLVTCNAGETADFILRGHAHEYRFIGDDNCTAFICPALKIGMPDYDRYGRRVKGKYHVGFLECFIDNGRGTMQEPKLYKYQIEYGGYEKYDVTEYDG